MFVGVGLLVLDCWFVLVWCLVVVKSVCYLFVCLVTECGLFWNAIELFAGVAVRLRLFSCLDLLLIGSG